MAVIAVAGAGGYLGSAVVYALTAAGHSVRPLVRTKRAYLSNEQRVADLAVDQDAAIAALNGVDALVHVAGSNETDQRPEAERQTVAITRNLAQAAERTPSLTKFVYLSTMHVYGPPVGVVTEETPLAPAAPYARARADSEVVLGDELFETSFSVLRLTNAVGPPVSTEVDRWTLVANDLCRQAVETGTVQLQTAGLQWRDFVDLAEVTRVIELACGALPPEVYNLGSGQSLRVLDLAHLVQERAAAKGVDTKFVAPDPEGEPPPSMTISISRLRAAGVTIDPDLIPAIDATLDLLLSR